MKKSLNHQMYWKIKVCSVITKEDFVSGFENRYYCTLNFKRMIAFILRWRVNHHRNQSMLTGENKKVTINFANKYLLILDISQIKQADRCTIKLIQSIYFSEEMKKLLMMKQGLDEAEMKKASQIYILYLYLNQESITRVGGRLNKSNLNNAFKG